MNDTIFEEESRLFVNPQTSLNEQQQFIDTLRDIQAKNTAQINQNTYNLGSPVTSNIGGLIGSEGLWKAQYQTPQTQATVAGLKATMQENALKTELNNQLNFWKNRYNQAQRNYNRAASTLPSTPTSPDDTFNQGINEVPLTEGNLSNINPDGTINAVVSGPPGTIATAGENYIDYQNEAGETVRHYNDGRIEVISGGKVTSGGTSRESVNDAITRLENSGKTVTNKRITADDEGNVVLTWRDQNGNEGSETIKVDINYRGTGLF